MGAVINGVEYAFSNLSISLFGNDEVEFTAISYTKRRRKDNLYRRGSNPKKRTRGNYEFEGSVPLPLYEVNRLMAQAQAQGYDDIIDLPPFEMPVNYALEDGSEQTTDIIQYAEFTEIPKGINQNDPEMTLELPLIIGGIKYNA